VYRLGTEITFPQSAQTNCGFAFDPQILQQAADHVLGDKQSSQSVPFRVQYTAIHPVHTSF
jgi:hypothetical protein